jgi:putative DNA primase/helicase
MINDYSSEDALDRRALGDEPTDDDIEIGRLARLSLIEYERDRKAAAERMGVRTTILDRLVEGGRARLGLSGGATDGKQGHAVSFPEPEPWPEAVSGAELLDEMASAIRKYVVLSDFARDTIAIWALHTYLIDRFLVSPRLGICSPTKQCGKTTLLDILGRLVLRALPTANVTPAAIFRVVEGYQPTLLVDEADTFLHDNDELRGILNGNRKGSQVLRTVGDDFEVRAFATYSPCAISLIGSLPDTLHDRSVGIALKRRLRTEQIEPYRPDRADHLDVLARKAVRWAQDHADRIAERDPEMPPRIINREADNWRCLLALADEAGREWPQRARAAALAAHAIGEDDEPSRLELLLGDIRYIFNEQRVDRMASADMVEALVAIEGRPWAEMGRSRKPLTQNQLARLLKRLSIVPDSVRTPSRTTTVKGYHLHQFQEAFARYLLTEGGVEPEQRNKADETGTSDPFQSGTDQSDVPDRKCDKSNNDEPCSGVADGKGGSGEKTHARTARPKSDDLPYDGPVVAVPDLPPDPLDEHGVPVTEPGLSHGRIRELAAWYLDKAVAQHETSETGDVSAAELDAGLRAVLAEEVFPEYIEIEFERVMKVVFAM